MSRKTDESQSMTHKLHEFAALIGPAGELCISLDGTWNTLSDSDRNELFLWASERAGDDDLIDWRRATVRISVPVLGRSPVVEVTGEVEVHDNQEKDTVKR